MLVKSLDVGRQSVKEGSHIGDMARAYLRAISAQVQAIGEAVHVEGGRRVAARAGVRAHVVTDHHAMILAKKSSKKQ